MEINTRIKYLVALLCSVNLVQCDPVWDNINCFPQYPEDTPIGEWLFNLTATTSIPNDNLIFSAGNILTVDLVNLTEPWSSGTDKYTVGVVLIKELDRDFTPNPKLLQFDVKDSGDTVSRSCELIVLDVNDNAPIFRNLPYTPKVPEDISVGSVIFGNISVYDPDTSLGGTFTVAMKDDPNNAGVFTLNWTPGSGTASINLLSPLDYEQRNSFTIIIIATDGLGLVNTAEIIVTVEDVQDTPPYFLQPVYRAAIPEHSPPDSSVIKLYAEDGDRGIPREIRYRLVEGNSEFFRVEALTGMVYQKVSLDRDDDEMREINGVFDLVVQAYEVNALPSENATTNVTVTVTIEDINDNAPTFNTSTTYTAYVREDTPSDSLIYFDGEGYMRVFDLDQGLNAYFKLTVEKDGQIFPALMPSPVEVFFEAYVLIRVINTSVIREYTGQHLTFDVVARETKTDDLLFSKAAVVLTIVTTSEPTTTPLPAKEDPITAPDIVVFVVGFLVVLNIVTSVSICYLMRRNKKQPLQGLARNGSKYYVNVIPKVPGLSISATENNNGLNNTSVMQEIPE